MNGVGNTWRLGKGWMDGKYHKSTLIFSSLILSDMHKDAMALLGACG